VISNIDSLIDSVRVTPEQVTLKMLADEAAESDLIIQVNKEHVAVRQLAKTIKAGDLFYWPRCNYLMMILETRSRTKYGLLHKWMWMFHYHQEPGLKVNDTAELTLLRDDEEYEYVGNLRDHVPGFMQT